MAPNRRGGNKAIHSVIVFLIFGLLSSRFLEEVMWGKPQIEDIANIRFQIDPRIFIVMSTLEAARLKRGEKLDVSAENSLRRRLLEDLQGGCLQSVDLQPLLDLLERGSLREVHSDLTSLALALGQPPGLAWLVKPDTLPEKIRPLVHLQPVFQSFFETCRGQSLWEKYRPAYEAEIRGYVPLLRDVIHETLQYFHIAPRIALDRRIVFVPDLLNSFGTANARNVGHTYYLILGPKSGTPSQRAAIRHEYLHFLVDPLVLKYGMRIVGKKALLKIVERQPEAEKIYLKDLFLVTTESLLSAVELRLSQNPDPDRRLLELYAEYHRGRILVFYFDEVLANFERKKQATLIEEFPRMITGISVGGEREREKQQEPQWQDLQRRSRIERLRIDKSRAEMNKLVEANQALQNGEFPKADRLLREIILESPDNANALFGLAQIEGREEKLDDALVRYETILRLPDAPMWITGWCLVRSARILLYKNQRREAILRLRRAASLVGDTHGAREAAQKQIRELREKPDRGCTPRLARTG